MTHQETCVCFSIVFNTKLYKDTWNVWEVRNKPLNNSIFTKLRIDAEFRVRETTKPIHRLDLTRSNLPSGQKQTILAPGKVGVLCGSH